MGLRRNLALVSTDLVQEQIWIFELTLARACACSIFAYTKHYYVSSYYSKETIAITIERLLGSTLLLFVSRGLYLLFSNFRRTLKKVLIIVSSK